MVVELSLEFEALGDQDAGWSESFYAVPSGSQTAFALLVTLANLRAGCLSASVNMPWGRIQPVPIGSAVPQLVNFTKLKGVATVGQILGAADYQTVKGLLRLVSLSGLYTRQWLGGISGASFGTNGQYVPSGSFKTGFNAFLSGLAVNGFCIRKLNPGIITVPPQGGLQKQPINSISIAGVLSCPNNGIPVGQLVYVGRVKTGYGLRGFWKVATNDGSNITLQGWVPSATQIPNTKGQYVQNYQYMYPAIASNPTLLANGQIISTIVRSGKHAVGRPKNPTTGRRKKRVT